MGPTARPHGRPLERYYLPTLMFTAGDLHTWSFSLEPRQSEFSGGVFCDFVDDSPGEVWLAE